MFWRLLIRERHDRQTPRYGPRIRRIVSPEAIVKLLGFETEWSPSYELKLHPYELTKLDEMSADMRKHDRAIQRLAYAVVN